MMYPRLMKRSEWAKAIDPFIVSLARAHRIQHSWRDGVLKLARPGSALERGVEINVKRILLRAGSGLLGENSVHRDLRSGITANFMDQQATLFPELEATYFQESGVFALIPELPLPVAAAELEVLVRGSLDANDWLAGQVAGLKPGPTAVPRPTRPAPRQIGDSDYQAVVAILRLSRGLHPAAARRIRERVCGLADLIAPTGISVEAHRTQEPRIREHVVPCATLVRALLGRIESGDDDLESALLLKRHLVVVIITEKEARRLNSVLASRDTMPCPEWNLESGDTYDRLTRAGISWLPAP